MIIDWLFGRSNNEILYDRGPSDQSSYRTASQYPVIEFQVAQDMIVSLMISYQKPNFVDT